MEAIKRVVVMTIPVLRLILAAVFVYAGVAKLLDVSTFAAQLHRFGLANPMFATVFAHYLPFLEIACGAALLVGRFTLGALTIYLSLLVVFDVVLAYAWWSGNLADCGCFGAVFGPTSIQTAFVRNLGLFAAVTVVFANDFQALMRKERRAQSVRI